MVRERLGVRLQTRLSLQPTSPSRSFRASRHYLKSKGVAFIVAAFSRTLCSREAISLLRRNSIEMFEGSGRFDGSQAENNTTLQSLGHEAAKCSLELSALERRQAKAIVRSSPFLPRGQQLVIVESFELPRLCVVRTGVANHGHILCFRRQKSILYQRL